MKDKTKIDDKVNLVYEIDCNNCLISTLDEIAEQISAELKYTGEQW